MRTCLQASQIASRERSRWQYGHNDALVEGILKVSSRHTSTGCFKQATNNQSLNMKWPIAEVFHSESVSACACAMLLVFMSVNEALAPHVFHCYIAHTIYEMIIYDLYLVFRILLPTAPNQATSSCCYTLLRDGQIVPQRMTKESQTDVIFSDSMIFLNLPEQLD